MSTTRRLPRAERRQQLVDTATGCFAAKGYNAASMDEVAEAADVSKPVLYQHFDSKLDLYLVVLQKAANSLMERLSEAMSSTDSNQPRLRSSVRALFAFVDDQPKDFSVLFRADSYEPQALQVVQSMRERMSQRIGEVVKRSTQLTWSESFVVGRSVLQMGEGAAIAISEDPELNRDHIAEVIGDVLWTGLDSLPDSFEQIEAAKRAEAERAAREAAAAAEAATAAAAEAAAAARAADLELT